MPNKKELEKEVINTLQTPEEETFPQDELLTFLNGRKTVAKKFTKKYMDDVDRSVKDYEAEEDGGDPIHDRLTVNRRYEFIIPYIFATHESYLSSIFEKAPDLIITGRGKDDENKALAIRAAYEYLWDKLDLDSFVTNSAFWMLLPGFASADIGFKSEFHEIPAIDPDTGEEMMEDDGETPIMTIKYDYNDPTVKVDDPKKVYFSPDSEYKVDGSRIPYLFREALTDKDVVEDIYERKVESTDEMEIDGMTEDEVKKFQDEIDRVKLFKYYGPIPKKHSELVNTLIEDEKWELNQPYMIVFTSNAVLSVETRDRDNKSVKVVRMYGRPNKFFGFGLGKTLRQFQKELSIRRGQQIRYADVAAYAKIALEASSTTDPKSLTDPRENVVITYTDKPPSYLVPPDMSSTLMVAEEKAREDAQFVSGMLDMSKGAQNSNTVDTATGQMIFAQSAEKRVTKVRKELGKYLRAVVIQLLKLAALHWDEAKMINITDEDGNNIELEVTAESLADIDFDTDIDIDLDTITVNKEVIREQVISLYDKTKDDPIINRRKVFKLMLRVGYNIKDPESYLKESEIQPGMTLQDVQSGQVYVVGDDGELVSQTEEAELATPSNEGGGATTQAGLAGNAVSAQ